MTNCASDTHDEKVFFGLDRKAISLKDDSIKVYVESSPICPSSQPMKMVNDTLIGMGENIGKKFFTSGDTLFSITNIQNENYLLQRPSVEHWDTFNIYQFYNIDTAINKMIIGISNNGSVTVRKSNSVLKKNLTNSELESIDDELRYINNSVEVFKEVVEEGGLTSLRL